MLFCSSPSCKAIARATLKVAPGSEKKFAICCPANKEILGAGIFDLEGLLIGTVSSLDDDAYNLKFAQQSCHWVDELEAELQAKDVKVNIL